jgi:SAM-dependent methyltransferase
LRSTAIYNKGYYRKYRGLRKNYRVSFTLDFAETSKNEPLNILDLGCGVGTYSAALLEKGHHVLSVDVSKEALLLSKSKGIRNLALISATDLPFKDDVFDRIFFLDVFEHLGKPKKALKEIYRILSPGGFLILATLYPSFIGRFIHSRDSTHQNLYTVEELKGLLQSSDFKDAKIRVGAFLERLFPFDIVLRQFLKTMTTVKARK